MLMNLIWIIVLIFAVIMGFMSLINYHNSKNKIYLIGTIACIVIVVLETCAILGSNV